MRNWEAWGRLQAVFLFLEIPQWRTQNKLFRWRHRFWNSRKDVYCDSSLKLRNSKPKRVNSFRPSNFSRSESGQAFCYFGFSREVCCAIAVVWLTKEWGYAVYYISWLLNQLFWKVCHFLLLLTSWKAQPLPLLFIRLISRMRKCEFEATIRFWSGQEGILIAIWAFLDWFNCTVDNSSGWMTASVYYCIHRQIFRRTVVFAKARHR